MAYVCQNCGKSTVFGRQSRHARGVAGRRWRKRAQTTMRLFKPNLQKVAGMRLCTDCISKLKKEGRLSKSRLNQDKLLQTVSV